MPGYPGTTEVTPELHIEAPEVKGAQEVYHFSSPSNIDSILATLVLICINTMVTGSTSGTSGLALIAFQSSRVMVSSPYIDYIGTFWKNFNIYYLCVVLGGYRVGIDVGQGKLKKWGKLCGGIDIYKHKAKRSHPRHPWYALPISILGTQPSVA